MVPDFQPIEHGRWRIRTIPSQAQASVWGDTGTDGPAAFLERTGDGGVANWMSTTLMERESQEIGIHGATGTTLMLGLGLGWAALNTMMNPSVTRLIVVERDAEVIALSARSGVFAGLSPDQTARLEIVAGDAFTFVPDGPIDTLLADIWPSWLDTVVVEEMRAVQKRINAARVHFWGQEAAIWRAAATRFGPLAPFDWEAIRTVVADDIALPLILPDWDDYPQKIVDCLRRYGTPEIQSALS